LAISGDGAEPTMVACTLTVMGDSVLWTLNDV
jgi:hypothetical protein